MFFMVWLSVRIHMMNQNRFPALSGLFLRLCLPGQPAIQMNGNHTALIQARNGCDTMRCGAISHKASTLPP
jgi:hypothetical protein